MPTPTTANKKYLTKLVKSLIEKSVNEQYSPEEIRAAADRKRANLSEPTISVQKGYHRKALNQPLGLDLQNMQDARQEYNKNAFQKVAAEHEKKYKEILGSLSRQERWVLNTHPDFLGLDAERPSEGQRRALSLKMSEPLTRMIPRMEKRIINNQKYNSVLNIKVGISDFLKTLDLDESSLKYFKDDLSDDRGSMQYAENFWNFLKNKAKRKGEWSKDGWKTDLNKEILEVINLPTFGFDSFNHFYKETLYILNNKKYGSDSLIVSYITYKMSQDKEVRGAMDALMLSIALATMFLPAVGVGIAATLLVMIVEFLILDIGVATALGASGSLNYSTVSKEEALRPLQDLQSEIAENDDLVTSDLGSKYFEALSVIERFMTKFVYDIAGDQPDIRTKIQAMIKSQPRTTLNSHEDLGNNADLKERISGDIEKVELFFKDYEQIRPQEIKVTLERKAKIILNSVSGGFEHTAARAQNWRAGPGQGGTRGLMKEQALPFKTSIGEDGINRDILVLLFGEGADENPGEYSLEYLTSKFVSLYSDFDQNPIGTSASQKKSVKRIQNLWQIIKRGYARYIDKAIPHRDIDSIMAGAWCFLGNTSTRHLNGKSDVLTLGIIKSRAGGRVCSVLTKSTKYAFARGVNPTRMLDAFAEMIRFGAIGKIREKVVYPKNEVEFGALMKACNSKVRLAAGAIEKLDKEQDYVSDSFYEKRMTFLKSYKLFYDHLYSIFGSLASDNVDCNGPLLGEIESAFAMIRFWNGVLP